MNKTIIPALETSDGAGVKIFRSIGHTQEVRLDPFLMLMSSAQKIQMTTLVVFLRTHTEVLKLLLI